MTSSLAPAVSSEHTSVPGGVARWLAQGAPRQARRAVPAPESLHPSLWRGHQLGRDLPRTVPSGFDALDAALPGGGWPHRMVSELLLPHVGVGELRLLAHALGRVQQAGRLVMFFDPPAALSAWALSGLGLSLEHLLVIDTRRQPHAQADGQWALEQALKSGHVGAVLAWLPPRLRSECLRRLQVAAQAHDGPAFMVRESAAQGQASAAPLRLALRAEGGDCLGVDVLKRRGPPLAQPLVLRLPPVLHESASRRAQALMAQAPASVVPAATFINLSLAE